MCPEGMASNRHLMIEPTPPACKICGTPSVAAGTRWGQIEGRAFHLRRCIRCHFAFVADPCTDYARLYSELYYRGEGADPLVDYQFELEHPEQTVRRYEWRGIYQAVASLIALTPVTEWLDFGCGNGGLVRYCRSRGVSAVGFEEGSIVKNATAAGIPLLTQADLTDRIGRFDVITAIEVLEHLDHPLETLRQIRRLLKPDGLFFFTTGNASPYRDRLASWSYVIPEIHISFYEPDSLREALERSGFSADFRGYLPGFTDIIRFKILKNLRVRTRSAWEGVLPWSVLAHAAHVRYRVTAHPIGWARD
jgi:SAM-dependent methyltransferase